MNNGRFGVKLVYHRTKYSEKKRKEEGKNELLSQRM